MRPPFPEDEPRRYDDGDEPGGWRFSLTPAGLGLLLFLVSLIVFFLAGIAGYVIIRMTNPNAPPPGEMQLPLGLWVSTVVLVVSGLTMHLAQRAAVDQALGRVRTLLVITLLLGVVFVSIQLPALRTLMAEHWVHLENNFAMYGFTGMLVALHGLHVLGGFVPLSWLTLRTLRDQPPYPDPLTLRHMEIYWHFLHIVWVVMFIVFLVVG
ncbi:MAG: cytochrome c oxidase subunit 3 [Phycisphaeraceae bacterium]